jgi:hypothetical protein
MHAFIGSLDDESDAKFRRELADLRLEWELLKLKWRARKYSPDQPRVPEGNPDGGQWTRVAANDRSTGYPVDLNENAHVLAEHVKSRDYVLERAREIAERARRLGDMFEGLRIGSFSSLEAANKLVNSTLAQNQTVVDQVAQGAVRRDEVEARFGSPTGYEAYVRTTHAQPELRDTYGVRVVIGHDPFAARGYRIITAYPIR